MQVMYPVCGGIAVPAAQLTACLRRVNAADELTTALVTYGTTSRELVALRTWSEAHGCPVVACRPGNFAMIPSDLALVRAVLEDDLYEA